MSLIYNMIVFLESDKNDFTIYFNPSFRASKVRLISCSLFNSWYNLIGGSISHNYLLGPMTEVDIPNSHYTPITLAKELDKHGFILTTGQPHEMSINIISSLGFGYLSKKIEPISESPLARLLGVTNIGFRTQGSSGLLNKPMIGEKTPVKWKVPNAYEVHCSLVRTYDNGSLSNIMSKFTPKGEPFELVEYEPTSLTHELSSDLVESIHIVIKVDGEVVDFNNRHIKLVLAFI